MNAFTKFVAMPMRGHGNVTGADVVMRWTTGYPVRRQPVPRLPALQPRRVLDRRPAGPRRRGCRVILGADPRIPETRRSGRAASAPTGSEIVVDRRRRDVRVRVDFGSSRARAPRPDRRRAAKASRCAPPIRRSAVALVIAVAPRRRVRPSTPTVQERFEPSRVEVRIHLERSANATTVVAEFRPLEDGLHLYGRDLPADGIDGAGRPTRVDVVDAGWRGSGRRSRRSRRRTSCSRASTSRSRPTPTGP